MSPELVSIAVLVAMFVVATIRPVNIGVLGFVAAFVVGSAYTDLAGDEISSLFPGDLFVLLVGITFLFAIAQDNGTIDWLVDASVRAVGGRLVAIPWIMFVVAATMTAVGAVSPGAVAILAPVALGVAARHGISQMLMGLMVVHGAQAGGFSPISVYGVIVNGVVARADLPSDPVFLFLASLIVNFVVAVIAFLVFGGLPLLRGGRAGPEPEMATAGVGTAAGPAGGGAASGGDPAAVAAREPGSDATPGPGPTSQTDPAAERPAGRTREQTLTLVGLAALAVAAVGFNLDVGLTAFVVALVLAVLSPDGHRHALNGVAWSVVVLVGGVLTYVGVMEEIGTIDYVGNAVAGLAAPLVVALLLCYVGGIVSAFASSVAILGATIPLAVPFLQEGAIGAVAMIAALSVSSTVVDCSPLSTNGALVLANSVGIDRDVFFKRLMAYGAVVVALAPPLIWFFFVVLGG
ncbi:MAG TPA: SLC13 family permease [Euzebyales bacterium]|nr:SLC13 family permease [Euzebyales bacterium]